MKILLVSPPFDRFKEIETTVFPLGLGYIASALEQAGHEVRIYNADIGKETKNFTVFTARIRVALFNNYLKALNDESHYVWEETRNVIKEFNPDLVGITITSDTYSSAVRLIEFIKRDGIKAHIVVGGPHATLCYKQVINEQYINYIVRSEGEHTICELVQELEKNNNNIEDCCFSHILGLSYKKNGETFHNENRPFIKNLNELPLPARHLVLFPELYPPCSMNLIMASRGCPYNCSYCASATIWHRKFRMISIEIIIKDIKQIVEKYNVKNFRFWDDTFTSIKNNIIQLCKAIIKEGFHKKVTWNCITRVNVVDDELLYWLKKSNCTMIAIGIESGSQRILNITNKGIKLQQIEKAAKLIKKHRFLLHTYWMLGLPDEREEDIIASIKFLKKIKPDSALVNVLIPYPGTLEYEKIVNKGLLPCDYDWKDPFFPYDGYAQVEESRFNELYEEFVKSAEQIQNRFLPTIKRAWIYRKALLQNPIKILKELRRRLIKRIYTHEQKNARKRTRSEKVKRIHEAYSFERVLSFNVFLFLM